MPHIASYNPNLRVTGTNEVIKLGLDDWYEKDEILKKLGKIYGAGTIAELVEKIKSGLVPKQSVREGLMACELGQAEGHCLVVDESESLA